MGLIVDNFAGGGGASTGIELALGRRVDIAINHDQSAIDMHRINHPYTKHYCESVWDVDIDEAVKGQEVDLLWASPDCTHFSKAKGKAPKSKKIRGLAWIVVKWAAKAKPRVIILENVEEFKTWGPIDNKGQPIKSKSGQTFHKFIQTLKGFGYSVDFRELKACDYGAPTIRKRFFMIARLDGLPIIWPIATHSKDGKNLPKWRTASEIIDWNIPTKSIFERKKPLSDATCKRISRGIEKFVIDNPSPFIVQIGQTGFAQDRSYSLDVPLTTIVTKNEHCLVAPVLTSMGYPDNEGKRLVDIKAPLQTVMSGGNKFALVTAFLDKYYSGPFNIQSLNEPMHTLTAHKTPAVVAASIIKHYGGNYKGSGSGLEKPLGTVTTVDHHGLVCAFLDKYYGGQQVGKPLNAPIDTVTTKDRFSLVSIKIDNVDYVIIDIGMRMLVPRELYNAQGFPSDYIIDRTVAGKLIPKSEQIARCGNSVPPAFAEALVRANLPELACQTKITKMSDLHNYKQQTQLSLF